MTDDKYVRVSDTLYEQHSPSIGKPLKWAKVPDPLYLELFDAQAVEGTRHTGLPTLGSGDIAVKVSELRPIKQIRAAGKLEQERKIGFISEAGPSSRGRFTEMSVIINGASDELLESGRGGVLIHMTGDALRWDDHKDPYLALELYIPQSTFDTAWTAVRNGTASQMHVRIYVAVFQSEVDRALSEPWMHQTYYIEDDSANAVTFNMLSVAYPKIMRRPVEQIEEGIESAPEPEKAAEPLVTLLKRNIAVMNQIAGSMKIVAGGIVAVAVMLLFAFLR